MITKDYLTSKKPIELLRRRQKAGGSKSRSAAGGYSSMDKGKSPKGQNSQPGFDNKGNGNAYGKNKENNGIIMY